MTILRILKYVCICSLAIVSTFSFAGCDKDSSKKETKTETKVETPSEEIAEEEDTGVSDKEDAKNVALDFVSNNTYLLLENFSACNNLEYFKIGSMDIPSEDPWYVYVKGTFFPVDEYGSTGGKYKYDWKLKVEKDGSVKSVSVKTTKY